MNTCTYCVGMTDVHNRVVSSIKQECDLHFPSSVRYPKSSAIDRVDPGYCKIFTACASSCSAIAKEQERCTLSQTLAIDRQVTLKEDRDIEKEYSPSESAAKLRRLADAIEKGERFEIQIDGERIYVPVHAVFNIEHEREGDEEEIEFQLKWNNAKEPE